MTSKVTQQSLVSPLKLHKRKRDTSKVTMRKPRVATKVVQTKRTKALTPLQLFKVLDKAQRALAQSARQAKKNAQKKHKK